MRQLFVATLLFVAGCAAEGLPLSSSSNGNGSGGNGAVDMAKPLGGTGAQCKTACDCQPGLACRQGTCGMSRYGQIYCCTGECPAGNVCQTTTGALGYCGGTGGTGGGGPGGGGGGGFPPPGGFDGGFGGGGFGDAGAGGYCQYIQCSSNSSCMQLGCGTCDPSGVCSAP